MIGISNANGTVQTTPWVSLWSSTAIYTTVNTWVPLTDTTHTWDYYDELEFVMAGTASEMYGVSHHIMSTVGMNASTSTISKSATNWNCIEISHFDSTATSSTQQIQLYNDGTTPKFLLKKRDRTDVGLVAIHGKKFQT